MSRTASREIVLPRTAVYALRASACLAGLEEEEWANSRRLAAQAGLPSSYVSKVMRQLVTAGLVEAKRGWHGGFRLARPPGEIHLAEVLAAVDESFDEGHCVFGFEACDSEHPCPLHDAWAEVKAGLIQWSWSHTLADAGPCTPPEAEAAG